ENYPLELRSETVELDIRNRNLQGSLKLKEFANLKKLNCANNQLTELDLSDCPNLEKLECCDNQLIDLEFLNNLNQKKMINLEISNNNFSNNCDLNPLSSFVNLKELGLGNKNDSYERIRQGVYNHFIGSLEPLKNMNKLEKLDISNTDINSGLEYLPDKLEIFYCLTSERPEAKVKAIYNLFANEKGIVEEEELIGSIKDFPQKLQKYKTSLQIPQIKAEIDKILATNNFNSEQLVQQLISDNHANTTIENLKKVQNLEKQKQEELRQAEIRRILTTLISVERLYTIRRVMDRFLEPNRGVLIASGVQLIRVERHESNKLKQSLFAEDAEDI
ncbi:6033_t:CDS:2, partial [Funneliformis geosporum]